MSLFPLDVVILCLSYCFCFFAVNSLLFLLLSFPSVSTIQEKEDQVTSQESKDNRALVDNNSAQSLTGEDIEEMRR